MSHSRAESVTPSLLRGWPLPEPHGAKRSRGQVLVVGGARTTPGAVMLAGLAGLRAGAGVLSLAAAESTAIALALAVPEAAVTGLPEDARGAVLPDVTDVLSRPLARTDAVLIGPGLDDGDLAREMLMRLVPSIPTAVPVVLDAYALSALAALSAPELTELHLGGRVVLTPNSQEAATLAHLAEDDLDDPASVVRDIAVAYDAVVSCHGFIADPAGALFEVGAGHVGLGTSGSGDVLAGLAAGLLARGAPPLQAACWATYLHAAAGDRLAARVGRLGFIARELLPEIPLVLTELAA